MWVQYGSNPGRCKWKGDWVDLFLKCKWTKIARNHLLAGQMMSGCSGCLRAQFLDLKCSSLST